MEKEFIPYEQALALKELGFDEPCFAYYLNRKLNIFHNTSVNDRINSKTKDIFSSDVIVTPTFSQAFRWFREKYGLHSYIEGSYPWFRYYINSDDDRWEGFKHLTYEEAEIECLKKLIEIIKTK